MADDQTRREPQHDNDYDGAWKEALRDHLPEFIGKYFPAEYAVIDWSEPPEWYDKELSQAGPRASGSLAYGRRSRKTLPRQMAFGARVVRLGV